MDMLEFLGFDHVEFLRPKEKGLEGRYYKGQRGTFLAMTVDRGRLALCEPNPATA